MVKGHEKDGERVFFEKMFEGKRKGYGSSNMTTQHGLRQTHTHTHTDQPTTHPPNAPTKVLFNLCLLPLSHGEGSICFCQLSLAGVEARPFAPSDPKEEKEGKDGANQRRLKIRTNLIGSIRS
jgi:hypothetical protein